LRVAQWVAASATVATAVNRKSRRIGISWCASVSPVPGTLLAPAPKPGQRTCQGGHRLNQDACRGFRRRGSCGHASSWGLIRTHVREKAACPLRDLLGCCLYETKAEIACRYVPPNRRVSPGCFRQGSRGVPIEPLLGDFCGDDVQRGNRRDRDQQHTWQRNEPKHADKWQVGYGEGERRQRHG
jgi:hypothetical protein